MVQRAKRSLRLRILGLSNSVPYSVSDLFILHLLEGRFVALISLLQNVFLEKIDC
jgi:hypothetical protein